MIFNIVLVSIVQEEKSAACQYGFQQCSLCLNINLPHS